MRPTTDDDDGELFDENGLLRDGKTMRVPMFAMDGVHRPGFRIGDASARDARQLARDAYDDELVNAWKHDALPAGAHPLSAGEGRACTIDGFPGTLVREGNYLVCKPTRHDAAPTLDARSAAYAQYDREVRERWKGPGQ